MLKKDVCAVPKKCGNVFMISSDSFHSADIQLLIPGIVAGAINFTPSTQLWVLLNTIKFALAMIVVIINRLRLGHCRLTHLYLMSVDDQPVCATTVFLEGGGLPPWRLLSMYLHVGG